MRVGCWLQLKGNVQLKLEAHEVSLIFQRKLDRIILLGTFIYVIPSHKEN